MDNSAEKNREQVVDEMQAVMKDHEPHRDSRPHRAVVESISASSREREEIQVGRVETHDGGGRQRGETAPAIPRGNAAQRERNDLRPDRRPQPETDASQRTDRSPGPAPTLGEMMASRDQLAPSGQRPSKSSPLRSRAAVPQSDPEMTPTRPLRPPPATDRDRRGSAASKLPRSHQDGALESLRASGRWR